MTPQAFTSSQRCRQRQSLCRANNRACQRLLQHQHLPKKLNPLRCRRQNQRAKSKNPRSRKPVAEKSAGHTLIPPAFTSLPLQEGKKPKAGIRHCRPLNHTLRTQADAGNTCDRCLHLKLPLLINDGFFAACKNDSHHLVFRVHEVPVQGRVIEPEGCLLCGGQLGRVAGIGIGIG